MSQQYYSSRTQSIDDSAHNHQMQRQESTDSYMAEGIDTLQPCASTNSLFLFAQGSSIICLNHDTLAIEQRFEAHAADISLIAADTSSDASEGRVISLDVAKEAVVWESATGEEVARFTAYEEIRVATFMRNGTIALGDAMGNIILFDPVRSEAVSCRTFQVPITTIAPTADSKFFAIGYENGAMIIATLMPLFVVHHTLAHGSDSAYPVTEIAWHGSSSRQKSDMLATQSDDGDLKVWSIAKPIDGGEPARIVRMLKKPENFGRSRNWMSWSRNGRIVQYSDSETAIWDVRTKRVVWEPVPTLDGIIALSVYGPKGFLFTITSDFQVQQYSLYPPTLVTKVQHTPALAPPTPPLSIGETEKKAISGSNADHRTQVQMQVQDANQKTVPRPGAKRSQSDQSDIQTEIKQKTALGQIAHELEKLEKLEQEHLASYQMSRTASESSAISTHSRNPSIASVDSAGAYGQASNASLFSQRMPGSSLQQTHPLSRQVETSPETPRASDNKFVVSTPNTAVFSKNYTGELSPPAENSTDFYEQQGYFVPQPAQLELFPNLKSRLSSVSYQTPAALERPKYDDELRKEMFLGVFGWTGGAEAMIRDEINSLTPKSLPAVMLRLWLGDLDHNALSVLMGSDMLISSDWMFVALSAMGGPKSWQNAMRVFIMNLVKNGDVHTAVMCLMALGEKESAVDMYVSSKKYMEAVILYALHFKDWRKLSGLVRKWGEHAAENGEGGIAMRCFACTETPSSTPPPTSGTPKPPGSGHSRDRSFSGSIKSGKASSIKLPFRPISPPIKDKDSSSLSSGVARIFGFGKDKNKTPDVPTANIMEMPWNKPPEEGLPTSPTVKGFFEAAGTTSSPKSGNTPEIPQGKTMVISGPMGTIGTPPTLSRVGSPAPSIARTVSPRPGLFSGPSRTESPGPPDRTTSPPPPSGPIAGGATNQLPFRMASPGPGLQGPIRIASPPPRTASPLSQESRPAAKGRKPSGLQLQLSSFQDVLASEPSPELSKKPIRPAGHKRTQSGSKLAEEVYAEDRNRQPSPPRRVKSPLSSGSRSRDERRQPVQDVDEEDDYAEKNGRDQRGRNQQATRKEALRSPSMASGNVKTMNKIIDESEPEGFNDDDAESITDDSYADRAERALEARRRSLERMEEEMSGLRRDRAKAISRTGSRNTNKQPLRNHNRQNSDYSEDEDKPRRRHYDDDMSEEDEDEFVLPKRTQSRNAPRGSARTPKPRQYQDEYEREPPKRMMSRNQNRTPKPRQREYDDYEDEDELPTPRRPASPPQRYGSPKPRQQQRQRYDDEEEEEFRPPKQTASRNVNRTPKLRQDETSEAEEFEPPKRTASRAANKSRQPDYNDNELEPPRRTASRNVNRTPKPRQQDAYDDNEFEPPRRTASRNVNKQRHYDPTESEISEFEPPKRTASRNVNRKGYEMSESEVDEERSRLVTKRNPMPEIERSPSVAPSNGIGGAGGGLPNTPAMGPGIRTMSPAPPRYGTPSLRPPMAPSGLGINHQRNVSTGDGPPPAPSTSSKGREPIVPPPKSNTPAIPDYDVHSYDLPALAEAANKDKAAKASKEVERNGVPRAAHHAILDTTHKSSLPQHLRNKMNDLPQMPLSPMGIPSDLPMHPAFATNMRATTGLRRKTTTKAPSTIDVGEPGQARRGSESSSNYVLSPGKQALRMHGGPGRGDTITIGLEGVVMDDGGAPVETAPPPRAGAATPMGQKI